MIYTQVLPTNRPTVARLLVMLCAGVILWMTPIVLGTVAYWYFVADACR